MVIVNTNIDYIAQLFYGKDAVVSTWVKKIGNKSLILYEEIHQDHQLGVKASTTYVNFKFDAQKSEPIPDAIRKQLAEHLLQ